MSSFSYTALPLFRIMTWTILQMNWKHNFTAHQNYEVQAHLFTYSLKITDTNIVTDFQ